MIDYASEVKRRVRIEEVIQEDCPLRGSGRYLRCAEHDSLVVDTQHQAYFWNSEGEQGDVFTWVMKRKGWDFKRALEYLAQKAGVTLRYSEEQMQKMAATRRRESAFAVAARVMHEWLKDDKEALGYAKGRGWSEEAIEQAMLGFTGRDTAATAKAMREAFGREGIDPESPEAIAVLGFRGDVRGWAKRYGVSPLGHWVDKGFIPGLLGRRRLVYPHLYFGRVVYLSARNILGDDERVKAFNLPVALAGPRQPFYNHAYRYDADEVVIVEGQADAISLGQWGFPAVATAGTGWKDFSEPLEALRERHETLYYAMDADEGGMRALKGRDGDYPLADVLGAMTRVVRWPDVTLDNGESGKDANDLLRFFVRQGVAPDVQAQKVREVLDAARPMALVVATDAGQQAGARRDKALQRAVEVIAQMPPTLVAAYRQDLAEALGYTIREFNALLRAYKKERGEGDAKKKDDPQDIVETLGGWFPVAGEGEEGDAEEKGWLLEYIYDRKARRAMLAYRDPEGKVGVANYVDIGGTRYVPAEDEIIKAGAVIFPSALGKLKETRELVAILTAFVRRYFLLDNPLYYKLVAYYVLLTWLYDAFSAVPYLRAQGDTNTGKSELMLRVGHVCYRMILTTGASSTASLKFALHTYRGTAFMDEMDIADKFDERIVILNVGAMRDQAKVWNMQEVSRGDGTRGYAAKVSDVYGPKLITMYGKFSDPATEGRCLTLKLSEKEPIELARAGIPTEKTQKFYEEAEAIRNLLLRWRMEHWQPRIELDADLADMHVSTRINQVTMPIKWIAKHKSNDPQLLKDVEAFTKAMYSEMLFDRSLGTDARVMDAIVAALEEEDYAAYVMTGSLEEFGEVRYILYKHLASIANDIMDEMNLLDDEGEGGEGEGEGHKRRRKSGISPRTVGKIAREVLRLPVQRTNKGYVVILDEERIEVLKRKYGLS